MRIYLIVSILIFLFLKPSLVVCQPIIQSNCNSTPELISKFKVNASKLAARITNERQKDTLKLAVELDSLLVDSIFNGLMAIYNSGLGEADTIFNGVRGGGATIVVHPSVRSLRVWTNRTNNFLATNAFYDSLYFKNKVIASGNAILDSIFSIYTFTVSDTFTIGDNYKLRSLVLNSSKDLNLALVEKQLKQLKIDSITEYISSNNVEISYVNIDYQNLTLSHKRDSGFDEFEFFVGWNDCPSGCQSGRTWKFRTYDGCKVQYLGAKGDYVSIKSIPTDLGYTIYPNPSTTHLNIEGEVEKIKKIEVYDALGRSIESIDISISNSKELKVDISNLETGIYYIKVIQEDVFQTIKTIKQ